MLQSLQSKGGVYWRWRGRARLGLVQRELLILGKTLQRRAADVESKSLTVPVRCNSLRLCR
eukprot:111288-Pelagomonas_calceolata.AAC.1